MTHNNINNRINIVYQESGLKQVEFAKLLRISPSYIGRLLKGNIDATRPSDTLLSLIEKEFGYSFNWLKTGEGPMKDPAVSEGFTQYGDKELTEICCILKNNLPELKPTVLKLLRAKMMELEAMGEIQKIKKYKGE